MRSAECGKCGVWKMRSVANEECGKCGVWKRSLANKDKSTKKKILPFITQYHPALPNVKNILMGKWHLIQNQPYLKEIFQEPPILSYRKVKSLKDTLVRAKL